MRRRKYDTNPWTKTLPKHRTKKTMRKGKIRRLKGKTQHRQSPRSTSRNIVTKVSGLADGTIGCPSCGRAKDTYHRESCSYAPKMQASNQRIETYIKKYGKEPPTTKYYYPFAVVQKKGKWINRWTKKETADMKEDRLRAKAQYAKELAAHASEYCSVTEKGTSKSCWLSPGHSGKHYFMYNDPRTY